MTGTAQTELSPDQIRKIAKQRSLDPAVKRRPNTSTIRASAGGGMVLACLFLFLFGGIYFLIPAVIVCGLIVAVKATFDHMESRAAQAQREEE